MLVDEGGYLGGEWPSQQRKEGAGGRLVPGGGCGCPDLPPKSFLLLPYRYGFGEAGKPKYGIQANAELVYEVTLKSFEKVRAGLPRTPHTVLTLCPWPGCATAPAEVETSARIAVFLICSCVLVCFIFLAKLQGWSSYLFLTLFLLYFFFFLSPWAAQKKKY